MTKYFYRFRPLDRFFSELENQHIYFASPAELNDPMEGVIDIYWTGDLLLWKNLAKHYLLVLTYGLVLTPLGEGELSWEQIPLHNPFEPEDDLLDSQVKEAVIERFFSDPLVQQYIEGITARTSPVRANELAVHLSFLHHFYLNAFFSELDSRSGGTTFNPEKVAALRPIFVQRLKIFDDLNSLDGSRNGGQYPQETYCVDMLAKLAENDLLAASRMGGKVSEDKNYRFLMKDFPFEYVRKIEWLLYPRWYTACFMESCTDSSIWGTYGNNHTGICLKFRASSDVHEGKTRYFLNLDRLTSHGSRGPERSTTLSRLHPVEYSEHVQQVKVDFFQSMGAIPIIIRDRHWLSDGKRGRSKVVALGDWSDELRAEYWKRFDSISRTKLKVWSQECEYRIILQSYLFDLHPIENRLLTYDFDQLDGIIFGLRTSISDKLKVIRAVEGKCKQQGRTDFRLYQARFSLDSQSIEHTPINWSMFSE